MTHMSSLNVFQHMTYVKPIWRLRVWPIVKVEFRSLHSQIQKGLKVYI